MLPHVDRGELILEVISWQPAFVEALTRRRLGPTADLRGMGPSCGSAQDPVVQDRGSATALWVCEDK